jgi:hypothetical protein
LEKAKELKKQKDEMQLKMFEKAIDPLWIQQDPENKGYITKDQSGEMVKLALEKVSMSQYYN